MLATASPCFALWCLPLQPTLQNHVSVRILTRVPVFLLFLVPYVVFDLGRLTSGRHIWPQHQLRWQTANNNTNACWETLVTGIITDQVHLLTWQHPLPSHVVVNPARPQILSPLTWWNRWHRKVIVTEPKDQHGLSHKFLMSDQCGC